MAKTWLIKTSGSDPVTIKTEVEPIIKGKELKFEHGGELLAFFVDLQYAINKDLTKK